jgi:hypothetical protein
MNDHLAYLRAVVLHRCPELTDANLAALMEPDLPAEIAAQVLEVIDQMTDRLDALEAMMMKDDDDGGDRGRARQAGEGDLVGGR